MHVFHTLYTLISQWLLIALTTVPNISKNSIEGCFLVLVREREETNGSGRRFFNLSDGV